MLKQAFHSYEMWNISEEWDCLENSPSALSRLPYNCILSKILPPNLLSLPLFEVQNYTMVWLLYRAILLSPHFPLQAFCEEFLKVLGFYPCLQASKFACQHFMDAGRRQDILGSKTKGECLAHSYGTNENISIYLIKPQTQQNDIKRVKWQP